MALGALCCAAMTVLVPAYIEMTEQRAKFVGSWGVGDPEHLRPVGTFPIASPAPHFTKARSG